MIKFFRNIRKQLLSKGETGKYLKYAIGEIILVVLGILIALSINNWNQNEKYRKEEKNLLENLREEFTNNLTEIGNNKELHTIIKNACLEILDYTNPDQTDYDEHKIRRFIGITTMSITFKYREGSLNSLINSGKVGLIRNTVLRNQITQFPAYTDDIEHIENTLREITWSKYFPYLEKRISLVSLNEATGFFQDLNIESSAFNVDYDSVLTDREFENLIMNRLAITEVTLQMYDAFEVKLNEIIDRISEELNTNF